MFVDLDGEWPRENTANSAPKSFPFLCVAAAWETARLTFSLLSVSYLPQACWATSGPLNACILRSNWRCAYTNNGVTCSVYRSLGGGKEHIKKLTYAKRPPPKEACNFGRLWGQTYCETMLNWMARDTSVSHFSTWYRTSRDFNTKSRIHFKSTTLTSSKGCSKVRLEPPLSYLMFP